MPTRRSFFFVWLALCLSLTVRAADTRSFPVLTPRSAFRFPRGGGGGSPTTSSIATLTTTTTSTRQGHQKQVVTILQVLQARPWNWLRALRIGTFLWSFFSIWEAFHSIGTPYAQAVWRLLHGDRTIMPYFYYPSPQDLRVAQSIAATQAASRMIPSEFLPSLVETMLAVVSVVLFVALQWALPLAAQQWMVYIPLSSNNSSNHWKEKPQTNLAVALQVVPEPTKGKGKQRTTPRQLIRTLKPIPDSNKILYELDLGGSHEKVQWNPSNDKWTVLPP